MDIKIKMILEEYGLDEKEIKIYLLLVGNLELTAYVIAKKTGIHRSTTYDVLERLISKGFINKIEKDGKTFYSVLEISQLISKLKDKESILMSLIPQFEKLREEIPSEIRVLESGHGQKQFNFNLFNLVKEGKVKEIYTIGNGPVEHTSSQLFLERLLKEAKKSKINKKIKYRGIWDVRFKNNTFVKMFFNLGENRFIKNIPTNVTTVIFGDNLAYLFTLDNKPHVIEIKNKLIAEENKAYFLHLWEIARP